MQLRLQMLQSKMQILLYNVQNEILSLDDYLNILRERIKRDQVLAIYLKQSTSKDNNNSSSSSNGNSSNGNGNNMQDALRVMKRVKIMQKEVHDAEESMNSSSNDA